MDANTFDKLLRQTVKDCYRGRLLVQKRKNCNGWVICTAYSRLYTGPTGNRGVFEMLLDGSVQSLSYYPDSIGTTTDNLMKEPNEHDIVGILQQMERCYRAAHE